MPCLRPLAPALVAAIALFGGAEDAPAQSSVPSLPDVPTEGEGSENGHGGEAAEPSGWRARLPFKLEAGSVSTYTSFRDPAVPPPGPSGPDWTERLDLRMIGHPSLSASVGLLANLRLRTQFQEGRTYDLASDSHLDVQELALDVQVSDALAAEAGRINVRNGVATGFNPTDWFKNDSLVTADTFDVVDRREDRLGTLVGQAIWHSTDGIATLGYRPEVSERSDRVTSDRDFTGMGLDRTNGDPAAYATFTPLGSTNVSATLSAFLEPRQPGAGLEISSAVSNTVVIFGEWFGQRRFDFVDEARRAVALPDDVADALGGEGVRRFVQQIAAGLTWSLPFNLVGNQDISLTGEYHFNQAGLSADELDAWFEAGSSGAATRRQLWAVRGVAARRQEPLTEHQLFFRFSWADVDDDLDLAGIAFVSPQDGSALVELSADLIPWENLQAEVSVFATIGDDESAFASRTNSYGTRLALSFAF